MEFIKNKKLLFTSLALLLLLTIPVTISLVEKNQESRSRATGSTTLSFTPGSTASAPIQMNIGDTKSLDMMVDPGNNLVTFVRFQIKYDPTKVQLADPNNPFNLNTAAFPVKVEGPIVDSANGTVALSISVGSDATKALQKITKAGTVVFKAVGGTGSSQTTVTFTTITQALSSGSNDQASENVLSTTVPAVIAVNGAITTPSVTISPAPSSVVGTSTPFSTIDSTVAKFTILLHGIGAAGDNPNPGGNSLSNKNPLHPQRNLDIQIFDTNNQIVKSVTGAIIFDSGSGTFVGQVDLGQSFPNGNYVFKVKSNGYLRKLIPGIQAIKNMNSNDITKVDLVAGDTNSDNILNILDYNALLDCGYGQINPLPIADPNAPFNKQVCQVHTPVANLDDNDDGIIDSTDYNLFLRELSVQNGD